MENANMVAGALNFSVAVGNVVQDAAIFTGPSGRRYALFTIAVDPSGDQRETAYIDCCGYQGIERTQEIVRKGKLVLIKGKISTRMASDGNGRKRNTMRLLVSDIMPVEQHGRLEESVERVLSEIVADAWIKTMTG